MAACPGIAEGDDGTGHLVRVTHGDGVQADAVSLTFDLSRRSKAETEALAQQVGGVGWRSRLSGQRPESENCEEIREKREAISGKISA